MNDALFCRSPGIFPFEKLQAPNYSRTTTIFNRGQNKKCLVRCVEKKQKNKKGGQREEESGFYLIASSIRMLSLLVLSLTGTASFFVSFPFWYISQVRLVVCYSC